MRPSVRKAALTVHVAASVGWLGALIVFFAHGLASLQASEEHVVRATSLAMGLAAWFVILPLSIVTLASGFVQALGTAWGLLRHYWVIFKLALTAIATGVLLLKLQPISHLAETAAQTGFSSGDLVGLRTSLTVHAAGGLVVLLAALVLALYKPAGATGSAMPRWVKGGGAVLAAFIVLVLVIALFGRHAPGAH